MPNRIPTLEMEDGIELHTQVVLKEAIATIKIIHSEPK